MRRGSGRPVAIRFWEKVQTRPGQCWLWQGPCNGRGYGKFKLRRGIRVAAHRLSWELIHGPIPAGMWVLHRCDVKACVNPEHLWLGTATDNARDRSHKGRNRDQRGERNTSARLRLADVEAIRRQYAMGSTSQYQLARDYGISQAQVSRLVNMLEWGTA
jgi:hypothetical protein